MRIIFSISSDIGFNLGINWLKKGFKVIGTYRNYSKNCELLEKNGALLFKSDLLNKDSLLEVLIKDLKPTINSSVLGL